MFKRQMTQKPQIFPTASRKYPPEIFDEFMDLFNVKDTEDQRLLLKCYIVSLFIPEISKAILMLHGVEGAAKSACQRIIKLLVDPSASDLIKLKRKEEDVVLQLANNYVVYFDNVREIPEWISDLFCITATGGSYTKRMLYFDNQEMVFKLLNPIGFNGINLAATNAELLDRGLDIEVDEIPDELKKDFTEEIMSRFYELLPGVLSYIFDILSDVLAFGDLKIKSKTRMADWEKYCEIISRCMGYEPMRFIKAYTSNRLKRTDVIIEGSPVAQAIIKLMVSEKLQKIATGDGKGSYCYGHNLENYTGKNENDLVWTGSSTQFLEALKVVAIGDLNIDIIRNKAWPKSPISLSKKLTRIKSTLKAEGITIEKERDTGTTRKRMFKVVKQLSDPSDPSESQNSRSDLTEFSEDISDRLKNNLSEKTAKNHAQNSVSDMSDRLDDKKPTLTHVSQDKTRDSTTEKDKTRDSTTEMSQNDEKVKRQYLDYPQRCYYCDKEGFNDQDSYQRHGVRLHVRKPLYPSSADLKRLGLKPQGMRWEEEEPDYEE